MSISRMSPAWRSAGQAAHQGRGAADCGEPGEAARSAEQARGQIKAVTLRNASAHSLRTRTTKTPICDTGHKPKLRIHASLALGEWALRRSEMSDLHEARDPEREPQIDTFGWSFLAFAVAITAVAAMVAYKAASDTMVANTPVSQMVVSAKVTQ